MLTSRESSNCCLQFHQTAHFGAMLNWVELMDSSIPEGTKYGVSVGHFIIEIDNNLVFKACSSCHICLVR